VCRGGRGWVGGGGGGWGGVGGEGGGGVVRVCGGSVVVVVWFGGGVGGGGVAHSVGTTAYTYTYIYIWRDQMVRQMGCAQMQIVTLVPRLGMRPQEWSSLGTVSLMDRVQCM